MEPGAGGAAMKGATRATPREVRVAGSKVRRLDGPPLTIRVGR